MDFSTMHPREVAKQAQKVVDALRASGEATDVYYRMHSGKTPIIYATLTHGFLSGRGIVIREYQVERLAERLQAE